MEHSLKNNLVLASLIKRVSQLALLFITPVALATTQVYVTRDAAGNLIFSDRPSADAEIHPVEPLPTVPSLKMPKAEDELPADLEIDQFYTNLQILSPNNEANIPHGLATDLSAVIDVQPALRPGDYLAVLVDGQLLSKGSSYSVSLGQLTRGKHIIEARIVDGDGTILLSSRRVTIYIQQPSVLNKRPGAADQ